MKKLIPKKSFLIFSFVIAGFSVITYVLGLFLVYGEIDKIENYYNNSESSSGREARVRAIKSASEKYEKEIDFLRKFFIQEGDEVRFIEQIENSAKDSGIKFELVSLNVREGDNKSIKEDVLVRMAIEGSWQQIISFIESIQRMEFGLSVEEVSIDANRPGLWSGFVEFLVFRNK